MIFIHFLTIVLRGKTYKILEEDIPLLPILQICLEYIPRGRQILCYHSYIETEKKDKLNLFTK